VFTDPLPSVRRPVVARVGSRGNVFTESLPSNGCIRHNTKVPVRIMFGNVFYKAAVVGSQTGKIECGRCCAEVLGEVMRNWECYTVYHKNIRLSSRDIVTIWRQLTS
jgi:hypothetical protein